MATLKEFEEALRQHGMVNALAILEGLKKRDRESRSIAPARRVVGRKMTAELARTILDLHATTGMTQQEIAFKLGVNQGRVNEVIKRGKWLNGDPGAPEARSRDKAMERLTQRVRARRADRTGAAPALDPTPAPPPTAPRGEPVRPELPARAPGRISRPRALEPRPAALPLPLLERRPPDTPAPRDSRSAPRIAEAVSPIVSAQLAFLDL